MSKFAQLFLLAQPSLKKSQSIWSSSILRLPLSGGMILLLTLGVMLSVSLQASAQHYQQTNLVSDLPGLAPVRDTNLVNPWGLASGPTSPWWVADNGTGLSTLYTGAGQRLSLVVTIPPAMGQAGPSKPTGIVFNNTPDFKIGANPAAFIFVTEDGTISGWNGGTAAVRKVNNPGVAIYKGATLGKLNGTNLLYVANFHTGTVDAFDTNYSPFPLAAGAFKDPDIPDGYGPFNVQSIGDRIYVAFAKQDEDKEDEVAGPGFGFVDAFDASGALVLQLKSGRWLNAPWGVTLASQNFGKLSGRLLVGQFGSGQIATFDPDNGNFHGLMRGLHGQPLAIDGLWALVFGNGGGAGSKDTLFFTAGIDDEDHGLFGTITPVPKDEDDDD